MNDHQTQSAVYRARIAELEAKLTGLEAEVIDIRRELDPFSKRYDSLIKPKLERLEIIQAMIKDLEAPPTDPNLLRGSLPEDHVPVEEQFRRAWQVPDETPEPEQTLFSDWTPPKDYVPVEEQFRRAWQRPAPERPAIPTAPASPAKKLVDPKKLKVLYRKLARRYHPDLTTDPAARKHRNRLMAEINEAYSRQDYAALRALDDQPEGADLDQPLAAIELHQLRQIHDQLSRRIALLEREKHTLANSDLMELKLRASLLAQSGRDLLQEMADNLEREYTICLDHLDALRGG